MLPDCHFSFYPTKAKTRVFSYTLPYPFILYACFHKLLSAFSYLMHILDLTPTLQKPEPRKTLIMEVIPAMNILRKSLVRLYLPISIPDKKKAIWRIPAPSLSKVDVILLSFTFGTQQLRRSDHFSPSPGRAAMQRATEPPGSRVCMLQGFLRNTGPGCLC